VRSRAHLSGGIFEPEDIEAMSLAFEEICRVIEIKAGATREREAVAVRIIELCRRGERSPALHCHRAAPPITLLQSESSPRTAPESTGRRPRRLRSPKPETRIPSYTLNEAEYIRTFGWWTD